MTPSNHTGTTAAGYDLRFQSLFHDGRGYAFPCDAVGQVDLDRLSPSARLNYFLVRTLVGRDYAAPAVLPRRLH